MNKNAQNWLLFLVLSIIWGSSFILMKFGLDGLNPWQVAALRIASAGLVLLPTAIRCFNQLPKDKLVYIYLSGVLGNLVPSFLFCLAEVGISSALTGTLNAITPIFVIIIGFLFYGRKPSAAKIAGIAIAFTGCVLLLLSRGAGEQKNVIYTLFVIGATICYGLNVNMVSYRLNAIPSMHLAAVALVSSAIPALLVLIFTGFFSLPFGTAAVYKAVAAGSVLGIIGTALANIFFYRLMKNAGPVFSSMVTYGIPVVAIVWGIIYKEPVGWQQAACLLVILAGVFIANMEMIVSAAKSKLGRT